MVTFIDDDDIELKPCPFCGSTAGLYASYEGMYAVRCNYCRIGTVLIKNEQDAIELWNHRTEVTDNNWLRQSNCIAPIILGKRFWRKR